MLTKLKQRVLKQEERRKPVTDEFSEEHKNALLRIREALHRAVSEAHDKASEFSGSAPSKTYLERPRKSSWVLIIELSLRIEANKITKDDEKILDSLPLNDLQLLNMTAVKAVHLYKRVYTCY